MLLNYLEQIALHTIIDFNFMTLFCLLTIYNEINNDKISIMF